MWKKVLTLLLLFTLAVSANGEVSMANKYCNLQGGDKIRDSYTDINTGFDALDVDISALNADISVLDGRVDTIITTPISGEGSAQELIDARGGSATLGARLDGVDSTLAEMAKAYSNISLKFNDKTSNIIAPGNGVLPTNLNFDLVNINRTQHMTIPVYNNDFHQNIDNSYVDEFATIKTHNQIKYTWSAGQLDFDCEGADTQDFQEIYLKTSINFETSNFVCETDVFYDHETLDGTGTSVRVGMMKDADNFIVANYDRNVMHIQIVGKLNGVVYGESFEYQSFEVPYTMLMSVNDDTIMMAIKKDNIYHYIGELWVGNKISFNDPSLLNTWNMCIGYRGCYASKHVKITGLRGSYSSGMTIGSDYHVLTYEDGCAIKNDNAIYFTATIHNTNALAGGAGASGITIYKLELNSYKLDYVAQLCFKDAQSELTFGGGSSKIFYDRIINKWVAQVTNFKVTPCKTYIGTTEANILSGIHVINLGVMDVPDKTLATWDYDIIYDDLLSKYRCVYTYANGKIALCESTDILGTWSKVADNTTDLGEGCVFFRANGKYYVSKTNINNLGLDILNYPDLTVAGTTITNQWCNKGANVPNSWGQILTLNNGDTTKFYMIVFSGNKWGGNLFSYGNLWIYKAREQEEGIEFEENNIINF